MANRAKHSGAKKRCIFVDIVDGLAITPHQVLIDESSPADKTDLDLVMEALALKKPILNSVFQARGFSFLIESDFKPNKWIVVDEFDYVKPNSELHLVMCPASQE